MVGPGSASQASQNSCLLLTTLCGCSEGSHCWARTGDRALVPKLRPNPRAAALRIALDALCYVVRMRIAHCRQCTRLKGAAQRTRHANTLLTMIVCDRICAGVLLPK